MEKRDRKDIINLKAVFNKLVAHWYYFAIAIVLLMSMAYAYVRFADKIYHVKATILLKGKSLDLSNTDDYLKSLELFQPNTQVDDEIGILTSRGMIEKTLSKLDFDVSYFLEKHLLDRKELYGHTPFSVNLDKEKAQATGVRVYIKRLDDGRYRIKAEAEKPMKYNFINKKESQLDSDLKIDTTIDENSRFEHEHFGFTIYFNEEFNEAGKTYFVIHHPGTLVEHYRNVLEVEPITRESSLAELNLKDKIPAKQTLFLNTLLETYLEHEVIKRNQMGLKVIDFIDEQIGSVSDSLRNVESTLESFRSRNQVVDINTTSENLVKKLDELQNERSKVKIKLDRYMDIKRSLETEDYADFTAISASDIEDPLLSNLLIELSQLHQKKASLNYNTKKQNPFAEELDAQIKTTRQAVEKNIKSILDATIIAVREIDQRIRDTRNELSRLPGSERELTTIQRQFEFSDNVYNYLLEKRAEVGIAIASNTSDKMIVDEAEVVGYGPVAPNSRMIYLLSLVLGIGLPAGFIVVKDFLNDDIVSREDLEDATDIPVMGVIGHAANKEKSFFNEDQHSTLAESFRSLKVNYQYLTLGKGNHIIGITSHGEKEGKTFCTMHLGKAIANSGEKALIIDTDMRKPQMAQQLKLNNENGLSNYLIGKSGVEEIIQSTGVENLDVITSGPVPPNPIKLLGQPAFGELLEQLRGKYDTILLDSPPMGMVSEYIILMKYTDANIYVVRSNHTNRYSLNKVNELYEQNKIKNVSIILNDVKGGKYSGYYYGSYGR